MAPARTLGGGEGLKWCLDSGTLGGREVVVWVWSGDYGAGCVCGGGAKKGVKHGTGTRHWQRVVKNKQMSSMFLCRKS